ncbi:MAG TPA: DUF4173 domain-containing protein [Terriglobia bacterium]|nr:DUF4173 domain-containing protein [Terriglobia bacterium]
MTSAVAATSPRRTDDEEFGAWNGAAPASEVAEKTMTEKGKTGLTILGVAGLFGILGDALLRSGPWGLNLLLWMIPFAVAVLLLSPIRRAAIKDGGGWLLVLLLTFSAALVWRDSPVLKALSLLAILIALALLLLRAQGGRVRTAGVVEYLVGGSVAALNVGAGILHLVASYLPWSALLNRQTVRRPLALARGLALALPVLLLFGGLLVAGDPVFAAIMQRVLFPNFSVVLTIITHCMTIGVVTWLVAGYLRGLLVGGECGRLLRLSMPAPRLGSTEVSIVLGLVDALFLLFVLVQVRYLFGGASLVGIKPGLTYAEYARQGFFELVAVAALALPILLAAHWLRGREAEVNERSFRLLALVQVLLLFVIMASAVDRMLLYQREYGQTELRLYTSAFMGWLGLVFLWFILTVLRARRQYFVFGAMLAGFAVLASLYVVNPDAVIARVNLARAAAEHGFDSSYAASLSGDSIPVLVAGLPSLNPKDRASLARDLLHHGPAAGGDWRTWSLSRREAELWMGKYRPLLTSLAGERRSEGSGAE